MKFSIKEIITSVVTPLLVLVTTFFGFINNQKANELDFRIKEIELINKQVFDSLMVIEKSKKLLEFDRQFKFKIYDDVKNALIDGSERVQFVTAEFVTVMVEDETFRNALLKSLINSKSTSKKVKEALEENFENEIKFQIEQKSLQIEMIQSIRRNQKSDKVADAQVAFQSEVLKLIRVDIFYLEETAKSHNSKVKAEKLSSLLDKTRYKVKVRILPKLTNARKGYLINHNQIRCDVTESAIAEELNSALGGQFLVNTIASRTPGYISIFIYN